MMIVDRFSAGLDDLTRKQQGDLAIVLQVLERTKRFSAFEAIDNDTIASTMTIIMQQGYARSTGGGYPWTEVEITKKGRALIDAAIAQKENGNV
jgi:hypothetical protein